VRKFQIKTIIEKNSGWKASDFRAYKSPKENSNSRRREHHTAAVSKYFGMFAFMYIYSITVSRILAGFSSSRYQQWIAYLKMPISMTSICFTVKQPLLRPIMDFILIVQGS
jgi:hypothetical protein